LLLFCDTAALARCARANPADDELITAIRTRMPSDWRRYAIVAVTPSLVELAAARNLQAATTNKISAACLLGLAQV